MNAPDDKGKITVKSVEYSVAYHCNLRCAYCSHMSPFVTERFPLLDSFITDIGRLGQILHAGIIRLLGGEPLLNPKIAYFVKAAKESGIAEKVMVTTNGLFIHKVDDRFWENLDLLLISQYPGIHIEKQLQVAREKAKSFGTEVWIYPMPQFRATVTTQPHPKDWLTSVIFESCQDVHVHHCHMIYEGSLYKCPVPPFLPEYLRKLGMGGYDPSIDGFPIHAGWNVEDLRRFLCSTKPPESCCFCLGDLGKRKDHHQIKMKGNRKLEIQDVTRDKDLDQNRLAAAVFQLFKTTG